MDNNELRRGPPGVVKGGQELFVEMSCRVAGWRARDVVGHRVMACGDKYRCGLLLAATI
jgi:hypothetical protein